MLGNAAQRYLDLPERLELPERPPKYRQDQRIILTYLVYLVVKLTHYRPAFNFCFIEAIDGSLIVVSCRE